MQRQGRGGKKRACLLWAPPRATLAAGTCLFLLPDTGVRVPRQGSGVPGSLAHLPWGTVRSVTTHPAVPRPGLPGHVYGPIFSVAQSSRSAGLWVWVSVGLSGLAVRVRSRRKL